MLKYFLCTTEIKIKDQLTAKLSSHDLLPFFDIGIISEIILYNIHMLLLFIIE